MTITTRFQFSFALLRFGEVGHGANIVLWRQLCSVLVNYNECRIPAALNNTTGNFLLISGSVTWNEDLHLLAYNENIAYQNWIKIGDRLNNVRFNSNQVRK